MAPDFVLSHFPRSHTVASPLFVLFSFAPLSSLSLFIRTGRTLTNLLPYYATTSSVLPQILRRDFWTGPSQSAHRVPTEDLVEPISFLSGHNVHRADRYDCRPRAFQCGTPEYHSPIFLCFLPISSPPQTVASRPVSSAVPHNDTDCETAAGYAQKHPPLVLV